MDNYTKQNTPGVPVGEEHPREKIITIIVLVIVVAVGAWFAFSTYQKGAQDREIEKQAQELDALRAQVGSSEPLTQEELDEQSAALNELRKEDHIVADVDEQINELDALRAGSNQ
ncbi:hypothetical protein ACFL0K_01895 [Patescibacteria group bacterium]